MAVCIDRGPEELALTICQEVTAHFKSLPREYQIMAERNREALEKLGVW
jgi:hypothetical protein